MQKVSLSVERLKLFGGFSARLNFVQGEEKVEAEKVSRFRICIFFNHLYNLRIRYVSCLRHQETVHESDDNVGSDASMQRTIFQ